MSTGSQTAHGYLVEARVSEFFPAKPLVVNGQLLTKEWQEVSFAQSEDGNGVPALDIMLHPAKHDLLSYESAMSLAWSVMAHNPWSFVEVRIARYTVKVSYSIEKDGPIDMILTSMMERDAAIVKEDHDKGTA